VFASTNRLRPACTGSARTDRARRNVLPSWAGTTMADFDRRRQFAGVVPRRAGAAFRDPGPACDGGQLRRQRRLIRGGEASTVGGDSPAEFWRPCRQPGSYFLTTFHLAKRGFPAEVQREAPKIRRSGKLDVTVKSALMGRAPRYQERCRKSTTASDETLRSIWIAIQPQSAH
jgi:hypothetical protein